MTFEIFSFTFALFWHHHHHHLLLKHQSVSCYDRVRRVSHEWRSSTQPWILSFHAATQAITRYLSHNLYKSSCPCPHISPLPPPHYYYTNRHPNSNLSIPQCSKCPNHIILPRLTTSATLSTPIESTLRLLSSSDTPHIHLTIYSFARHMLNVINVRDTANSLIVQDWISTNFLHSCKHYTDRFQRPRPDPCSSDTSWSLSYLHALFYFLTFLAAIPWIVSATRTRSSALSNYAGRPTLNSLDNASSTRMKSSRLRTEPWCTPTLTLKAFSSLSSLYPRFRHWILIHCFFTNTTHSSTPSYLCEQQLNHLLGHHFKRFLRINKGHQQDWSSFFARYFSCRWRNIKIASVKRPPCHNACDSGFLNWLLARYKPCFYFYFTLTFWHLLTLTRSHIWEKIQY